MFQVPPCVPRRTPLDTLHAHSPPLPAAPGGEMRAGVRPEVMEPLGGGSALAEDRATAL